MRQKILKKLNQIAAASKSNLQKIIPFGRIKYKTSLSTSEIEDLFIRIHQSNFLNIAHTYAENRPFTQIIFDQEKWDIRKVGHQIFINCYVNNNHQQSYAIPLEEAQKFIIYLLDNSLKKILEFGIKELRNSENVKTANSFENENRSLEWLRVSLEIYKKALNEIQKSDELLLEFYLNLDTAQKIIIFKSYNIFWQIHFHHSLMRVQFYNDKDVKSNTLSKSPAMSGDFYHLKNKIWDLFINTAEQISQTFEKKF